MLETCGSILQAKTDEKLPQCASASASTSATSVADSDIIEESQETGESETSSQFVSNLSQQLRIPVLFKRHLPLYPTRFRIGEPSLIQCAISLQKVCTLFIQ